MRPAISSSAASCSHSRFGWRGSSSGQPLPRWVDRVAPARDGVADGRRRGGGVADGHPHAGRHQPLDERQGARQLGRQGHQHDAPAGRLLPPAEVVEGGQRQVLRPGGRRRPRAPGRAPPCGCRRWPDRRRRPAWRAQARKRSARAGDQGGQEAGDAGRAQGGDGARQVLVGQCPGR